MTCSAAYTLHYSTALSKEMSELGFPVNRLVRWMGFSTASAVRRIPTAPAFASQHYEWRDCLLGCPCQLLCDLPSFQGIRKTKEIKSGGGCETPQLSSTHLCLPYIFYLPVQDKANISDKFCVKYKWPSLGTNRKTGSEASRIAARAPRIPAYFSGLTNSGEEVPGETERLLWQTRSTIITPWWKSHGERASHR